MRLYWVRHGQMEIRAHQAPDLASVDRLFNQKEQGGLTELGQQQAEQVATHLKGQGLSAVYTSPLIRARETGEFTARAVGLDLRVSDLIAELKPGRLPQEAPLARTLGRVIQSERIPFGIKRSVVGATLTPLYLHAWWTGRTEDGESPESVRARLYRALDELRREHSPDARVALFSHGYLILLMSLELAAGRLARLAIWKKPYIPNGAITEIEVSAAGAPKLVRFASDEHLR